MTTTSPEAQIVIAVHDPSRPVRRAVDSVLESEGAGAIVVAHGIDPSLLDIPISPRVEILECDWGFGKPYAPFNWGIAHVQAPSTGVLGSDDWYQTGAVDQMIRHLHQDNADGVIAPLVFPGQPRSFNPLSIRHRHLRAAQDGLFYRTAPLGLFKTPVFQDPRYRFVEDVPAGGDILPSVRLWTDGLSISHYPDSPGYVVTDEATQRVTKTIRPLEETMRAITALLNDGDVASLPRLERQALVTKLLRVHVLNALNFVATGNSKADQVFLTTLTRQIVALEPRGLEVLPRAHKNAIVFITRGENDQAMNAIKSLSAQPLRDRVFPDRLQYTLSPGANPRNAAVLAASRARSALFRKRA